MKLLERVLSLVTPEECLVCHDEGQRLCDSCRQAELIEAEAECYHCRRPSSGFLTCQKCRPRSPLKAVFVAVTYQGAARLLIEDYKFHSNRAAVAVLADILVDQFSFSDVLVTHCPTVPAHYRQRGFDHARLLAMTMSRRWHLPQANLLRRQNNLRQVGANRAQRLRQMNDAFTTRRNYMISGQTILLIDDVMTTGATMEAAARALKAAGAKEVIGLVIARSV